MAVHSKCIDLRSGENNYGNVISLYKRRYGFEGIVKNNAIRMTKSEFLNDPNDLSFI